MNNVVIFPSTEHNRQLVIGTSKLSMEIYVAYRDDDASGRLYKAIALDNEVMPLLVRASRLRDALAALVDRADRGRYIGEELAIARDLLGELE